MKSSNQIKTNTNLKFDIFHFSELHIVFEKIKDSMATHVTIAVDDTFDISTKDSREFLVKLLSNKDIISICANNLELGNNLADVALALKNHKFLRSLDLSSCDIGEEGAKFLTEGLKSHNSLEKLSLGCNKIGYNGVPFIIDLLNELSSLTSLSLPSISITTEQIKMLTYSNENNINLSHLNLSNNHIGDDGIESLINIINSMPELVSLNLKNCGFSKEGIKKLSIAMGANQVNFLRHQVFVKN